MASGYIWEHVFHPYPLCHKVTSTLLISCAAGVSRLQAQSQFQGCWGHGHGDKGVTGQLPLLGIPGSKALGSWALPLLESLGSPGAASALLQVLLPPQVQSTHIQMYMCIDLSILACCAKDPLLVYGDTTGCILKEGDKGKDSWHNDADVTQNLFVFLITFLEANIYIYIYFKPSFYLFFLLLLTLLVSYLRICCQIHSLEDLQLCFFPKSFIVFSHIVR